MTGYANEYLKKENISPLNPALNFVAINIDQYFVLKR